MFSKFLSEINLVFLFFVGAFYDYTGSYDASFYLSGSLMLFSALICYPLKRINQWENKKTAENQQHLKL